jgi:hypothetical protein
VRTAVPRGFGQLGDAEIQKLHVSIGADEGVVRLNVAMDDAMGVGGSQAVRHLGGPVERGLHRDTTTGKTLAEGLALEQLGDEVGSSVVEAEVVDGDQIGVIERPRDPGFLLEAAHQLGAAGQRFVHHLEGDVPTQACVPSAVNLGHASGSERGEDLVGAEPAASSQAHVRRDYFRVAGETTRGRAPTSDAQPRRPRAAWRFGLAGHRKGGDHRFILARTEIGLGLGVMDRLLRLDRGSALFGGGVADVGKGQRHGQPHHAEESGGDAPNPHPVVIAPLSVGLHGICSIWGEGATIDAVHELGQIAPAMP